MTSHTPNFTRDRDPIAALLDAPEGAVLAVIAGVEGPSYRPVGAAMAVFSDAERAGTLSSGCVESDIALQAMEAAQAGVPRLIRYGRGSPFIDIQLPCGGGLDILLLPRPDRTALAQVAQHRAARRPCTLEIDIVNGAMALVSTGETGRTGDTLRIRYVPDIRFFVFGKGPEAATFAALVQSAGYPNVLLSPDSETLADGAAAGCPTRELVLQAYPNDLGADDRTAIVLFFHDHDWEPPILEGALATSAFYIGAQGSQRARDARLLMLEAMGVSAEARARLHGPVGLIPSARDAGTLAVSVLAEVLDKAMRSTEVPKAARASVAAPA
ncbi:MAG: XdhC family protein [Pseudomonadota bacterium]